MNKDIQEIKKALDDPDFLQALEEFTTQARKTTIKMIKKEYDDQIL
jgi:hypothetical protein